MFVIKLSDEAGVVSVLSICSIANPTPITKHEHIGPGENAFGFSNAGGPTGSGGLARIDFISTSRWKSAGTSHISSEIFESTHCIYWIEPWHSMTRLRSKPAFWKWPSTFEVNTKYPFGIREAHSHRMLNPL